jgi:pimeloyl-ACP methyl ester carboxylesterase
VSSFREHRYTTQDGLSLYYREYGDPLSTETPFLCLPGLARNSKDFHRVATRLSADRWVICPDYRGRGQSDYDPEPDNYQPTTYLQDIRHLLVVTGMHRAVVIGTSMGGLLATGLGVVAPSLLAGVVLNDIGPHIEDNGIGRIIDYLGIDHPHPDWDHAVAAFKGRFPTLSFDTEELWREGAEATWREREDGQLHVDWDVNIVLPMVQNKELPDLWALFRSLRNVPILAIRGGVSDVLSAETFDRMADEHPKLDRLCLEGVGHVPSLIEPESTEAIDRLLAQI